MFHYRCLDLYQARDVSLQVLVPLSNKRRFTTGAWTSIKQETFQQRCLYLYQASYVSLQVLVPLSSKQLFSTGASAFIKQETFQYRCLDLYRASDVSLQVPISPGPKEQTSWTPFVSPEILQLVHCQTNVPCVCSGQLPRMTPLLDGEQLGPIASIQLGKSIHWNSRCPGDKLQQSWSHFIVAGVDSLKRKWTHSEQGVGLQVHWYGITSEASSSNNK